MPNQDFLLGVCVFLIKVRGFSIETVKPFFFQVLKGCQGHGKNHGILTFFLSVPCNFWDTSILIGRSWIFVRSWKRSLKNNRILFWNFRSHPVLGATPFYCKCSRKGSEFLLFEPTCAYCTVGSRRFLSVCLSVTLDKNSYLWKYYS